MHKFRHKTLILVKMLMLQKKVSTASFFALCHADEQIMLFGYPVEMLCTYQYSLVSLIPGKHHSDIPWVKLNNRVTHEPKRMWISRPRLPKYKNETDLPPYK